MRVWLVEDRPGDTPGSLEAPLRQLAARPDSGLVLLGTRGFWPELLPELRARQPDLLVVREAAWPEGAWANEVFGAGYGVVVATAPERWARFRDVAESCPVCFIPAEPSPESLWLGLLSALAAQRCCANWKTQVASLQQRLADRIVIERAKGVLVQRLGITEDEAYKRLRVLSRRQRRQIRDIAQSLLDTQSLLLPEFNGFADPAGAEPRREPEAPPPAGGCGP
ncbi:MAG TPA: ANTAR domain-containing protein [Gemmataceae bacterium]|nr:ANTAR domain-containing protein [Gemmataceae bacterium]